VSKELKISEEEKAFLNSKYTNFSLAAILSNGNSFGEIALLHGGKRMASVVCKT